MAKFVTNARGTIWWPKLEPKQIALQFWTNTIGVTWWSNFELIQVENIQLARFGTNASDILFNWRDNSNYRVNTLGPLCLWQCLKVRFIVSWLNLFLVYFGPFFIWKRMRALCLSFSRETFRVHTIEFSWNSNYKCHPKTDNVTLSWLLIQEISVVCFACTHRHLINFQSETEDDLQMLL